MKNSSLCFQAAVLFVLFGMVWGIQMAISDDHSAFPAHAHNNLLGFVSLFLFGFYYYLHPTLEQNSAARVQVWVWIIATVINGCRGRHGAYGTSKQPVHRRGSMYLSRSPICCCSAGWCFVPSGGPV